MILGAILIILGFVLAIKIIWIIGIVLLVLGAIFFLGHRSGARYGGNRYWY